MAIDAERASREVLVLEFTSEKVKQTLATYQGFDDHELAKPNPIGWFADQFSGCVINLAVNPHRFSADLFSRA